MPRKDPQDPPEQGSTRRARPRWTAARVLGNGSTTSGMVLDVPQKVRVDPPETSEGIDAHDNGVVTQTTGPSVRAEAADGNPHQALPEAVDHDKMKRERSLSASVRVESADRNPHRALPEAVDHDKMKRERSTSASMRAEAVDGNPHRASPEAVDRDKMKREQSMSASVRAEAADGNLQRASPKAVDRDKMKRERSVPASVRVEQADGNPQRALPEAGGRDKMKRERSMPDLFLVIQEERPPTVLLHCSTAAVKEGLRNSDFMSSQLLEEFAFAGGGQGDEEDNTSRDEDEDRSSAETTRQDNRRCEPGPAQLKSAPGQVESGTDGAAPGHGLASCKRVEGGTGGVPLYLKGAEVGYRPDSPSLQAATVVDVHQDNLLEPYYTIRMREGGRERQTDNAHLVPGPWTEQERLLQN